MHMTRSLRAGLSIFRIALAERFQYRVAGFAGALTSTFWGIIEIIVYTVFFTYAQNSGNTGGMTLQQVISYVWLAQVTLALQPMSLDPEILETITNGNVGVELCRPMDLYTHWWFRMGARRLGNLIFRGGITLLFALMLPFGLSMGPPASAAGLAMFICSILLAFFLCNAFEMVIGAVRIGITWGNGPAYFLMLIGGVLSGSYLPLQLWPDGIQKLLFYQPFAGYLDLPARLYVGSLPPSEAFSALTVQLFWIIFFTLLGKFLMAGKLKNIIVQGG